MPRFSSISCFFYYFHLNHHFTILGCVISYRQISMTDNRTSQIEWDFILEKILEEKSVLVLGPEVFLNEEGTPHQDQLIKYLDVEKNEHIFFYYLEENFFLFDDPYKRTLICHQIKGFYKDISPGEALLKIAQLPFHIIMTVTPDKLLPKAFDQLGFKYQFGYYKKNKDPEPFKKISKEFPLIYNMFGCTESEESIILTHNDLYDYFKSIFARKSLPDQLKSQLKEMKNIIFLGVPFEKWYMQLLMRELNIHNQQYAFIRFASNQMMAPEIKTLCFDQFRINFIGVQFNEFVDELFHHCQKEGFLRKAGQPSHIELGKVREYVAQGELEKAISLLLDNTMDSELDDEAVQLAGRYRKYERRVRKGILYQDQKEVQQAQIMDTILSLAKKASEL